MIRINQIKLPICHNRADLEAKIRKSLRLTPQQKLDWQIVKKSIDARKKPELFYSYVIDAAVDNEQAVYKKVRDKNVSIETRQPYLIPVLSDSPKAGFRPVIIGAGPAGLFCAYALVLSGAAPLVLERGASVRERAKDVEIYWKTGVLNPASNVQFGEGGAGTFSDGKLNTLVKDTSGRNRFVLETFVKFGAPEEILYENKPHIGTDILANVIEQMRHFMEDAGAKFRFSSCVTDMRIEDGAVKELCINETTWIPAECVVLAPGHSARDTFRMLEQKHCAMTGKAFAVGFRVEHPQEMINIQQYGELYAHQLPAAPYKLTANALGRGVYSFCMCPGGYVVNASSEPGRLAVNGMSYSRRDSANANSAIIVSVTPQDFGGEDALAGVRFQEKLEEKAFALGQGKIPQQLFGDYCGNVPSVSYGAFPSMAKGETCLCSIRGLFPGQIEQAFMEGMKHFGHIIANFDRKDAILSGVESRTSSPVRITRDDSFQSNIGGLYPCGEGAGYAGGIMSAAMDGLKVAEAILNRKGWQSDDRRIL